jgi:hypothetical protein
VPHGVEQRERPPGRFLGEGAGRTWPPYRAAFGENSRRRMLAYDRRAGCHDRPVV